MGVRGPYSMCSTLSVYVRRRASTRVDGRRRARCEWALIVFLFYVIWLEPQVMFFSVCSLYMNTTPDDNLNKLAYLLIYLPAVSG